MPIRHLIGELGVPWNLAATLSVKRYEALLRIHGIFRGDKAEAPIMSEISRRRFGLWGAMALLLGAGGCAANPVYHVKTRVTDDLSVYKLFDNSRDWGSNYLVGPPNSGDDRRVAGDDSFPRQSQQVPSMPSPTLPQLP